MEAVEDTGTPFGDPDTETARSSSGTAAVVLVDTAATAAEKALELVKGVVVEAKRSSLGTPGQVLAGTAAAAAEGALALVEGEEVEAGLFLGTAREVTGTVAAVSEEVPREVNLGKVVEWCIFMSSINLFIVESAEVLVKRGPLVDNNMANRTLLRVTTGDCKSSKRDVAEFRFVWLSSIGNAWNLSARQLLAARNCSIGRVCEELVQLMAGLALQVGTQELPHDAESIKAEASQGRVFFLVLYSAIAARMAAWSSACQRVRDQHDTM